MPAPIRMAVSARDDRRRFGDRGRRDRHRARVLVKGTYEISLLFESSTSKYVDAPPLLEPVPEVGLRLTLNESPACGSSCVSVVIGKTASRYVWPTPMDTVLPLAVESVAVKVSLL